MRHASSRPLDCPCSAAGGLRRRGHGRRIPSVRNLATALWHVPDRLPSLAEHGAIHYQPGAEDFARRVSALLPEAIARIEAAHGRPFAHPVTVGVYATLETYAAANGSGPRSPSASRRSVA